MSATAIKITHAPASRLAQVDWRQLGFGRIFSDHMLVSDFWKGGWSSPEIVPYGPMSFSPSMSALHYGQSIFEGLKAFRAVDGAPRLFRPRENWLRMNRSAHRLCMPELPETLFMAGLRELVRTDQAWVPPADCGSLYVRPVMFATDEYVGVRPSETYRFVIFTTPVGAYYSEPVALAVTRQYARATEGGTGAAKMAGNYAGCLLAAREAQQHGYKDVLWLDSKEHRYVEECGSMNVFIVLRGVCVTPPVAGTILQGVTRDAVLVLFRDAGLPVEERRIAIDEVVAAHEAGELDECFGTGTAATVTHVIRIGVDGRDLHLPPITQRPFAARALRELTALRDGTAPDRYGWLEPI